MRHVLASTLAVLIPGGAALTLAIGGCGSDSPNNTCGAGAFCPPDTGPRIPMNPDDGGSPFSDGPVTSGDGGLDVPCTTHLCLQQVHCDGGLETTLTGTVYDPAGKVPLFGATVYVPNATLDPIKTGVSCDRCGTPLSGQPVPGTIAVTGTDGTFKMDRVPVGKDIPLVIQIGKWRREVTIPSVAACTSAPVPKELLHLPRKKSEGNIPQFAITTGGADSLECLPRRMGIDDSEFGSTTANPTGRVHLYHGYGNKAEGAFSTTKFSANFNGGAAFPEAKTFWNTEANLGKYDLVLFSCEGTPNEMGDPKGDMPDSKPDTARAAFYAYLDKGGRVFASHWHNVWFYHPTDEGSKIAKWLQPDYAIQNSEIQPSQPQEATLNTNFYKGQQFKAWLLAVGATKQPGTTLTINDARDNVNSVTGGGTSWMTITDDSAGANNRLASEYVSFNTPVAADESAQCGRAVYSDLHVSYGAASPADQDQKGKDFPDPECKDRDLSPQEKALEFLLFDLASCVTSDKQPPPPPH